MLEAVLFDLDGTLADTAPDLCGAANSLLQEEACSTLPMEHLRPYTSQGVRGLLRAAFGIDNTHADYDRLSRRFLDIYASRLCDESRLFPGIAELLDGIESMQLEWGIVTNKRRRFTDPLVELLRLSPRTRCVVSGDTTPEAKPSPLPILYACELLACTPNKSIYVGDDRRDIQAGRAAGCFTVAVGYGYLGDSGPIESWDADLIVDHPLALLDYLLKRVSPI
ncbi:MAG: HAD family hydrolase [Rhodocyclales bacterium GT-UBC]|nr:MAG: HAD family hydrolase [Rhodocyclales bacterium GT-UBC]